MSPTDTTIKTAFILAAGKGERLLPLTAQRPKPLIPLGGRPMITRVLNRLADYGFNTVHLNTHHLGEQIPAALGDGGNWGLTIHYHHEANILGTGGALLNAFTDAPELAQRPFLMINSDVLCDLDLRALCDQHMARQPLATLVLRTDPNAADFGIIGTDDSGRVSRFLELEPRDTAHEYMFTGIQVLTPEIAHFFPDGKFSFPITDAYKAALASGVPLLSHIHDGYWADLGTPERLMHAETDIAAGRIR